MSKRSRPVFASIVVVMTVAAGVGCKGKASEAGDGGAAAVTSVSAAAAPPAAADSEKPIVPNWMKDFPKKSVKAKVGDTVWAMVPSTYASDADVGRLGVYKVDAINGDVASVSNTKGKKFDVPGLFVIPVGDASKLKAGEAVVIADGFGWGPAIVTKADKGNVITRVFLSDDTAKDVPAVAATPIPKGSVDKPFALVHYEKFGHQYNGYLVAIDGKKAWVVEHGMGGVTVVNVTDAKMKSEPWVTTKERKVGDKVVIFGGMGATDGAIEKVIDPKGYWTVSFSGTKMSAAFDQVVDKI